VEFIQNGVSFITGTGPNSLAGGAIAAFETLESQVGTTVTNLKTDVTSAFNTLKTTLVGGGDSAGIVGEIQAGVFGVFNTLKTTLVGGEDSAGLVGRIVDGVRDAFGNLSEYLNSLFDLSGLTRTFENAITPIENTISLLIERVNQLLGLIDDIQVPDVNIPDFGSSGGGDSGIARNITGISELTNTAVRALIEDLEDKADNGELSNAEENDLTGLVGELRDRIEEGEAVDRDTLDGVNLGEILGTDRPTSPRSISRERPSPLNTGGLIESSGLATVHAGERVVPEAQITDRGRIESSGVQIQNLTVNADSRSGGRAAGRALKRELKRFDI
jgi:hypothetical protein